MRWKQWFALAKVGSFVREVAKMIGDSLGNLGRVFLQAVGTRDEEISDSQALGADIVLWRCCCCCC